MQDDDLTFVAEQDCIVVAAIVAGYDGVKGWSYRRDVSPEHKRCG
tara:strand:- start:2466 stop:2600 length:135 start_codon:yes stop_codon:yes gene_type:complete